MEGRITYEVTQLKLKHSGLFVTRHPDERRAAPIGCRGQVFREHSGCSNTEQASPVYLAAGRASTCPAQHACRPGEVPLTDVASIGHG